MSRIGKKIIMIPKGVEVSNTAGVLRVKGPKGVLERKLHTSMSVELDKDSLTVVPTAADESVKNFHGLTRSLVANMVTGVAEGFTKSLLLKGVGYRAQVSGHELQLTLGFSHPINYKIPAGIEVSVDKVGKDPLVIVKGADKEKVGQAAADIRSFRKPEPYHGKGVRYAEEVIVTKVGKSSGKK